MPDAARPPLCVPCVPLLGGAGRVPVIGLGTWRSDAAALQSALEHALRTGYRHIDCAALYGNEATVGAAIAASGVPRADLFLTSKLMPTDMHVECAAAALDKTLADLGTIYVDLYLLHWPFRFPHEPSAFPVPVAERLGYDPVAILELWRLLEKAVDDGKIRSIGVSNFSSQKLEALWNAARIKPSCNQVEMHPALQQQALLDWHRARGIVVTTYCPLGSPARPTTFRHGDDDPDILGDACILAIAAKHGRSPAQVVLRWAMQRGTVPLPKSVTPHRLDENLASLDFELDDADMGSIKSMDRNFRFSRGGNFSLTSWQACWDES